MINMMGYGYGMMGGFGFIIPLLLIGLIIYAVVKLLPGGNRNYSNHRTENDALDILNQRYAKGEISEEEYVKKKKILRD
jgi:putative membrane protein